MGLWVWFRGFLKIDYCYYYITIIGDGMVGVFLWVRVFLRVCCEGDFIWVIIWSGRW